MTSQGHPRARFLRALRTGNLAIAEQAARDLGRVSLEDALALVLLYQRHPERYERAAARWIARFIREQPAVRLDEVELLAALLRSMARVEDAAQMEPLAAMLARRGIRVVPR